MGVWKNWKPSDGKTCCKCKILKATKEFRKLGSRTHLSESRGGYCSTCLICEKAGFRAYYVKMGGKSPEKRLRDRIAVYQQKYGITLEEYEELLAKQYGKCAICAGHSIAGRKLSVDHDHTTGKVRGLLCVNCNAALGQFRESREVLLKAYKYLEAHESKQSLSFQEQLKSAEPKISIQ